MAGLFLVSVGGLQGRGRAWCGQLGGQGRRARYCGLFLAQRAASRRGWWQSECVLVLRVCLSQRQMLHRCQRFL